MLEKNFHVVGIGLSAGGQAPLISLISLLPPDLNASFVILPHLSPGHRSNLDRIIRKATNMQVVRVEHPEQLKPGIIYVLPENKVMEVSAGILITKDRPESEKMNYAIDTFFRSLAAEVREKAIGVILSGANDDGLKGANQINSFGGVMLAQDPLTAAFPRMPREIVERDHPAEVISPEELAEALIRRISGTD